MTGLRITDGTTTVNLTATDAVLKHYVPTTPEQDVLDATRAGVDGADVLRVTHQNITEQAEVILEGTLAVASATVQKLGRLFDQARHRQRTGLGTRVFVEYRVADTDAWYRSEILAGRVLLDESDINYDTQLAVASLEAAIVWTRRYYWEYAATSAGATDPLEIALGGSTGGTAITNDASNGLAIAAASVAGDLPAPLKLKITDTYATNRHYEMYISNNVFSGPTTFAHHNAGDTTATVGSTETLLKTWTLSSANLAALGGNVCHLLMPMSSNWPNTLWMRFKVYWNTTKLWEGSWSQQTGIGLKDMGAVALPPRIVQNAGVNPQELELRLYGRDATNHITYNITWLQILPTDGWRVLDPAGYGLAQNTYIVDDGIDDELWTDGWADTGYTMHYMAYGAPIMVWPNRAQKLVVVVDTDTGTTIDGRTSTVQAWYRPRRLVI